MKDLETKEKFIELRACGLSFNKIAVEIQVSKPTLIKWNSEFNKEIANRRFFAAEELLERYQLMKETRMKILAKDSYWVLPPLWREEYANKCADLTIALEPLRSSISLEYR